MKLEYKILWLDDNIKAFIDDEWVDEIIKHLKDNGFIPIIETVSNSTEFFTKLDDSYDLILTDYHMDDMNGDKVVERIRSEELVMTEVLFYTAKADLKDTQKISRISFLETNSSTTDHLRKVVERTIALIDLTIKKFQNVIAMRGMMMHETSSLDSIMLEVINKAMERDIEFDKDQIFEELIQLFESKLRYLNKWKTNSRFDKLIKDNFVFSAEFKTKTLSNILDVLALENFTEEYKTEVIKLRNDFAHVQLVPNPETGKLHFKDLNSDKIFDESMCIKIRKDIRKYLEYFEKALNKVTE